MSVIELSTCSWSFWHKTGAQFRLENPRESDNKSGRTREALSNKITWMCSFFFIGYMGAEGNHVITCRRDFTSSHPIR